MNRVHSATLRALTFLLCIFLLVHAVAAYAAPTTSDELKKYFGQPWQLLVLMYLGALGSALKTVSTARRDGSTVTLGSYLGHWPETIAAAVAVFFAWLGLVFTDQLNFAAALAYGAVANTGVDVLRAGGRTTSLNSSSPPPKE
jgi:hypothetical protein